MNFLSSIPAQEIELCTFDILQLNNIVDGICFYQNQSNDPDFMNMDKLVNGLHRLIADHYPIVVGRPQVNAKNKVVVVVDPANPNVPDVGEILVDSPAENYLAVKDNVKFYDIRKFYKDSGVSELPRVTQDRKGSLAIFRILRFKDSNYVGLLFSVSHGIFDGAAMTAFMSHWARYVRGNTNIQIDIPLMGDRSLVNKHFDNVEPKKLPFVEHFKSMFPESPKVSIDSIASTLLAASGVDIVADQHLIHFTKESLEQLRQDLGPTHTITYVLMSLMTRAVAMANTKVFGETPKHVYPSVVYDGRSRNDIPNEYSGNLSAFTTATLTGEMVASSSSLELTNTIHEQCRMMESGHTKTILDTIQKNLGFFSQLCSALCSSPENSHFMLSNMRHLPFHDIDFGHGKPEIVCFDYFFMEGLARLCQNYQDGGVDLFINFKDAHFAHLEEDPDVAKYGDIIF